MSFVGNKAIVDEVKSLVRVEKNITDIIKVKFTFAHLAECGFESCNMFRFDEACEL
ncbi:hypothetical protein D3C85_1770230 [compost metagenome]